MRSRWLVRGLKIAVIATVAISLFGFIVMSLWNWLAPAVFGAHAITFWQALGILVLCKILFGGFGPRHGPPAFMRHRMRERWARMSPEERERFREGLRNRCHRPGVEFNAFSDATRL
jgi:Ca2+/H+ antiporter, TMEM165/GDT1 family